MTAATPDPATTAADIAAGGVTIDPAVAARATAPALEMRGITKRFPGVVANDSISLSIRPGEIHGLLGENGAGKSTLMNILYGLLTPDEGEILLDGKIVDIAGPSDAIARGIGMVHQHFMLVPVFTVAENIVLGNETMANAVFLDVHKSEGRIRRLATQLGFEINPDAKVGELSVGIQQRIEILKALYRGAKILILDEPTAVLTPQETVEIFQVLRRLADEGTSIVFISHKLYEVLEHRRPDHRHPAWQGRRRGRSQDRDGRGPRRDDGRPGGLARRRQGTGHAGRRRAGRRGPDRRRRPRIGGRGRHQLPGSSRRDLRNRRGGRQRPGRAGRDAERTPARAERQGQPRRA